MRKRMLCILLIALLALSCFPALGETADDYLGKPMPDFTVQTTDGETFTLSEALEDYDLVVVNFWATWCTYCLMEFPYMEQAYERYGDRVALIALSTWPDDTLDVMRDFAAENGLSFRFASDSEANLGSIFAPVSIPVTVVVDRFGNVALVRVGAQDSADKFVALFDYFLDDGYTETTVLDDFPPMKPNVEPATGEALSAAANAEGSALAFRNPEDGHTWPMVPVEADGRAALASTNAGVNASVSAVYFSATAAEGDALAFDFKTDAEPAYDALFVEIDGEVAKRFTGAHEWTSWALPLPPGAHEIAVGFEKDAADSVPTGDAVWIGNIQIVSGDEAARRLAALPDYPVADEFALALAGEGLRRVKLDDPTGVIRASFGVDFGWIAGGDVAAEVSLAAGDDPETALLIVSGASLTQVALADALKADGSGYSVDVPVEAGGYSQVVAYPGTDSEDYARAQAALLFGGEEGADAFVEYVQGYGYDAGWSYDE